MMTIAIRRACALGLVGGLLGMAQTGRAAENLALGKPCTFSLPADYALCKGPDDILQLTDGTYAATDGTLWSKKECVGWSFKRGEGVVAVTVDLGAVRDLGGFSWHYAAGVADVGWPKTIYVYASEDAATWDCVGNLLELSAKRDGGPKVDRYRDYRAWSDDMPAKGRYVTIAVQAANFTFCDELEIYAGDATRAAGAHAAAFKVSNPVEHLKTFRMRERVMKDLERLGGKDDASLLSAIDGLSRQDLKDVRTVLPFNAVHACVWSLNARKLSAAGFGKPTFWRSCRWDNLDALTVPTKASASNVSVELEMMRGEVRSETINILNPTETALDCTVEVAGLPAAANVRCREVVFAETRDHGATAAALAAGEGARVTLTVPAGASRQVWISCDRPTVAAGTYAGVVRATLGAAGTLACPFRLRLAPVTYPARSRLHLYGWDYSAGGYGPQTAAFLKSHLALMRDIGMDVPWEPFSVLPGNARFDADGALENAAALDFAALDRWLERFSDVHAYAVFLASEEKKNEAGDFVFYGEKVGTTRFNRMAGDFFRAVADRLVARGRKEEQLMLCFVDEPGEWKADWPRLGDLVSAWSTAVRATCPNVKLFQDPTYKDPGVAPKSYWETSDIYCPMANSVAATGVLRDFYGDLRKKGKSLYVYSCDGPSRMLDPIAYYRGIAYVAFRNRAKGVGFWAFGHGSGGGDSWHAYSQRGYEYSPYFVSDDGATPTKQSEGIREGLEDFEYLSMLTDRMRAEQTSGKDVTRIRSLLRDGVEDILKSCTNKMWNVELDRTAMDVLRLRVLHELEK